MKSHNLFAATAVVFLSTAAYAADGTFDRTLTFSGAPIVNVSTGSGYIHVFPGSDNQVHVIGRVHVHTGGWTSADADARVRQIVASPPIEQAGNILTIGVVHADPDLLRNVSIDYEITTPASTTLKARSGSGELQIGGVQGEVDAESGSGDIKADNVGGNSRFQTGSGAIHATNVHGAVAVETGSGSLELSVTAPGDVKAQTGSGSIRLTGVKGGLRAGSGSGGIQVSGNPTAEWRLESGSGSIRMQLDPAARFVLNAQTGSGAVTVDRPIVMQGALNKHHVTGAVNGGGPTLRASTGSGGISIN